ncbi:MAG: hypothetical protein QOH49_816 [Acidobacteriota bacterium]|jgi:hypothetical protein|nr:hypothetical protein [Acidobacteriota bacterium]
MNNLNKLQAAVLCSLLLTGAACSSLSTGGGAAAPFTASADPRADMVKAMRASLDAKSYRVRRVMTSSNGRNHNMTGEVVMPDRMHITTEMEMPGRGAVKQEVIYIGKESYKRIGDAPWQKDPLGMGDVLSQLRDPKLIDAIQQKAEVKYLGNDTLDGAPMLVYQYTIKDLLGAGKDGVSKIWIGATDSLQHQVESESDVDPLNTGKMIHSKSTTTFYDYNADITIAPPM